jgi:hypothetical protein
LQFLAWFETNGFARWDGHFGARSGIAPDPRFAWANVEDAKAPQLDAVAFAKRLFHGVEDRFYRHFRFSLCDSGTIHHFIDNVQLDQKASPTYPANWRNPYDKKEFNAMSMPLRRSPALYKHFLRSFPGSTVSYYRTAAAMKLFPIYSQ